MQGPVYKSPYYNPVINRADYTYDIAGAGDSAVDSYGAPILAPVSAPDYSDYSYTSGTGIEYVLRPLSVNIVLIAQARAPGRVLVCPPPRCPAQVTAPRAPPC